MKLKLESSHVILSLILLIIIIIGIYSTKKLNDTVRDMSQVVNANIKNTMDPKAPDPGKTVPEKYEVKPGTKKVKIGAYLERIEDLDIKKSSWTYEFYLWFSWNPNEIDFNGKKEKSRKDEIPFSIINGDIIKATKIEEIYDEKNNIAYAQYFVKANNTQFFDVSLYPID